MSDEIKKLIEAIVWAVIGIGWAALVPFAVKWLSAKIGVANTARILDWADTFAKMAENKLGPKTGDLKLDLARSALEGYAQSQKIKITPEALEAAIEKAVFEFTKPGAPAPTAVGNVVVTDQANVGVTDNNKKPEG